MEAESGSWNVPLLHSLFLEDTVANILELRPPNPLLSDAIIWTKDPKGAFSVKGAVLTAQACRCPSRICLAEHDWSSLWRLPLQDRLKLLFWKIASESIPVRAPALWSQEDSALSIVLCALWAIF